MNRKDYHPFNGILQEKNINPASSQEINIKRYLDRTIRNLNGEITQNLLNIFLERSELIKEDLSYNTIISLYSDLNSYIKYCKNSNIISLPFNPEKLVDYISHLESSGKKRETINRHICSISKWSIYLEIPNPRMDLAVQIRLKKMRRNLNSPQGSAEPIRVEHLKLALEIMDPNIPRDYQDLCLLFVAFQTLCLASELVSFNWEDLKLDLTGTSTLTLKTKGAIDRSTDKELFISKKTTKLLLGWKERTGKIMGPIFRGIYSSGSMGGRLSTRGVQRCFKRIATRINLEPDLYSGQSTRKGAALDMLDRDIDGAKIAIAGRWVNLRMLCRTATITPNNSGMAQLSDKLEL